MNPFFLRSLERADLGKQANLDRYAATSRQPRSKSLLVVLIALSSLLAIPSLLVVYDIADREPFYGYSPSQLRHMMMLPILLEGLWFAWCLGLVIAVFARKTSEWSALLLLWAGLWVYYLLGDIHQYASDIRVLESPDRDWIMAHGKSAAKHR